MGETEAALHRVVLLVADYDPPPYLAASWTEVRCVVRAFLVSELNRKARDEWAAPD